MVRKFISITTLDIFSMEKNAWGTPLPVGGGVYALFKQGVLLYIGKSVHLGNRLRQHHNNTEFDQYIYHSFKDHDEMILAEFILIYKYRPPLNAFAECKIWLKKKAVPADQAAALEEVRFD